jgi:hypothetical protein
VEEIRLMPLKPWQGGKNVTVNDDSLVNFIVKQVCLIKTEETQFSSSSRGTSNAVQIILYPNKLSKSEQLYVCYVGVGINEYRLREGETTYFKNDTLCELIAKLTDTYFTSENHQD